MKHLGAAPPLTSPEHIDKSKIIQY